MFINQYSVQDTKSGTTEALNSFVFVEYKQLLECTSIVMLEGGAWCDSLVFISYRYDLDTLYLENENVRLTEIATFCTTPDAGALCTGC